MAVKFCGARTPQEIEMLAESGADLVGLWHGVPDGKADLSLDRLANLVEVAHATPPLVPVLVTLLNDRPELVEVVDRTKVRWVQLHGYQPPSFVRDLKRATGATVVKVLHVRLGECLERMLIPAYERAGTDYFLFDATTADGRVGSTGRQLDPSVVLRLASELTKPFMLAGGISAHSRPDFADVSTHPNFCGVDVDTAARDFRGNLSRHRIEAISEAWRITCGEQVTV
jgi:phosphoribosylanthranilate isomerase